jgi:hypothetical protein
VSTSFEAANNVIRVRDTNGAVVFDTGTPMPHIAQVITATLGHSFAASGTSRVVRSFGYTSAFSSGCRESRYICRSEYVCRSVYVCRQDYKCTYNFSTGRNDCGYVTTCGFEQQCGFEQVCGFEWVDVEGYETYESARVEAREHSQTYTLGTLPAGTNPDFLLVLITASRTRAGSQQDYGTFISAIPAGETICANGSTILETAFQPNGEPWLSRILSVVLEGDAVRAEFKHSNRQYTSARSHYASSCFGFVSGFAPLDDTRSDWTVSFEIYAGKFTT